MSRRLEGRRLQPGLHRPRVSASHLNAQTLCDLLLERPSDLLDCPFVNRRVIPWPPEPLRMAAAVGIRSYLWAEDWWYERGVAG